MQNVREKSYYYATKIIFPLILLLYPLRHIRVGVEWWDTGYNYGNFVYMENMDPMWVFSTYLGTALGNLFTKLPFGNYMMGLNFYTGLTVSVLALMGYYFYTYKNRIPAWIVFLGEMLAISLCWCPTALLYNYLTYIFMAAGVMALYDALTTDKNRFFVLAGIFLGINIFVRFPNLAEMALIVGVWAFGIIKKKKIGKVLQETGWCILGYAAGAGACLGYLALRYGLDEYVEAITRLLNMPSGASDYTVYSMIYGQVINYLENLKWLRYLLLIVIAGMLLFIVLPKKLERVKQIIYAGLVSGGFYYLYYREMYEMDYTSTRSVFHWAVFFLTATLTLGIVTILRKKASDEDKLQAGFCILIILITPLGSNNHLYSSINNLFLVAPFTLWMLFRFIKWLPAEVKLFKETITLSSFPVKTMIVGMLAVLGMQSLFFGYTYVFVESKGGKNLNTKFENNDILKGMLTDSEHAQALDSISAFVTENDIQGKEVILYGWIPSMSYYLQMPFAISSWPDLPSYHFTVMENDLRDLAENIQEQNREIPFVLLDIEYGQAIDSEEKFAQLTEGMDQNKYEKFTLLAEWIEQYHYYKIFENEKFILLQAK